MISFDAHCTKHMHNIILFPNPFSTENQRAKKSGVPNVSCACICVRCACICVYMFWQNIQPKIICAFVALWAQTRVWLYHIVYVSKSWHMLLERIFFDTDVNRTVGCYNIIYCVFFHLLRVDYFAFKYIEYTQNVWKVTKRKVYVCLCIAFTLFLAYQFKICWIKTWHLCKERKWAFKTKNSEKFINTFKHEWAR